MLKFIPIRAQAGIVGFESPATEYKELGLDLDALLIEHPSATYIGLAQGESMTRDGIFDGDLLIVSRAEPVTDLCICVANLNGVFVCKRVDIRHRRLLSGCPRTPPYQLTEDDDFQIEGVVIRSIRIHKPLRQTL
ncbi:S24 family peptidase [Salinimonas marina]|uniref:S24 family peptidase n=1 Tax=Salinimonas marina TaxID=2785918 RepID=A0A7S9DWX7_9ALTE|nr:S24 family peptidase [Salinimonas marina]QPG05487.1 S24 family peptidase [Salinimonas marina]